MSSRKRRAAEAAVSAPPAPPTQTPVWAYGIGALLVVLVAAFLIYAPALRGEFVFDDDYLPFLRPDLQQAPLHAWLGVRPLLMLSYWLNFQQSQTEPLAYHIVSVVLHALNAVLIWLIVRRFLSNEKLAIFAGALFLLHPANTESVAYVSSRSEAFSVFFLLSAWAVFVYRNTEQPITWMRSGTVLVLFGLAATTKEHTAVLPGLLLLTDYFITTPFRFEGVRRNLRLYVPILAGATVAMVFVFRVLSVADSAGFRVKEFTWYEYLFSQFHVIWRYVLLYILPAGLNADYDLAPTRTILDPLALAGLAGLIVATAAAIRYRREFPLAAFGWLAFLLLIAPTSSIIPIRDIMAERRLYLPFIGLLLITVECLRRWRVNPVVLGLIVAVAGVMTWQRAHVWSSAMALWADTVEKSPKNARAVFQLGYAQWRNGQCADASTTYAKAAALQPPDDRLLIDWALALDCENKPDEAVAKLQQAMNISPSALAQAQIGMVYGKRGRNAEALAAIDQALRMDPSFDMAYVYRGNILLMQGDRDGAIAHYRKALSLNPVNETAREALFKATRPR